MNYKKHRDNFCLWVSRKILPKRLVYFCAIRVIVEATQGEYSNTVVPELTAMEALDRFHIKWEQ